MTDDSYTPTFSEWFKIFYSHKIWSIIHIVLTILIAIIYAFSISFSYVVDDIAVMVFSTLILSLISIGISILVSIIVFGIVLLIDVIVSLLFAFMYTVLSFSMDSEPISKNTIGQWINYFLNRLGVVLVIILVVLSGVVVFFSVLTFISAINIIRNKEIPNKNDHNNEIQENKNPTCETEINKTTLGFSLTSLILGLIGIVAIFCGNGILWGLGLIAGILSIIFGIVAYFKKSDNKIIANTGITFGGIATIFCSIILITMLVSVISVGLPHSPVGNWVYPQYGGSIECTIADNYHGSLCFNYYNNVEPIEEDSWIYKIGYRGFVKTKEYDIVLEQLGTNIYRFTTSNNVYLETYYPQNGYLGDDGYDEIYTGIITLESDNSMIIRSGDITHEFIKSN